VDSVLQLADLLLQLLHKRRGLARRDPERME
jgi:hypothetical protein